MYRSFAVDKREVIVELKKIKIEGVKLQSVNLSEIRDVVALWRLIQTVNKHH